MENESQLKNQRRGSSRNIPDGVLFEEILVRLPVKTLTIYKSVCKEWLYRIESRSFREVHRRRHIRYYSDQILFSPFKSVSDPVTKSSSLLPSTHSFGPGLVKMTSIPLDVMLPPEMTRLNWPDDVELADWSASVCVLGPVRTTGIYCVIAYLLRKNMYAYLPSVKISICNPATRDYKLANPFPPEEMARLLDFTTSKFCYARYGFGLAADGDYKVVVLVNWGPRFSGFLSYVYSPKQGEWKKIVDSENAMVSRLDLQGKPHFPDISRESDLLCPQVFFNGCWHWMARFSDETSNVLSFDLDKEVFKLVLGPPSYRGRTIANYEGGVKVTSGVVSVLNDHLTALYCTFYSFDSSIDAGGMVSVWMMMEYGDEESWINVWTVNPECNLMTTHVGISYSLREDGRNGGIHINRILFQDWGKQLFSCDESGLVEQQSGFDTSSRIFWNNLGISAYSKTLELL